MAERLPQLCRLTICLALLLTAMQQSASARTRPPVVALGDATRAHTVGFHPDEVTAWRPQQGLSELPDRPVVIAGPGDLGQDGPEALLDALLARQATVVFPDGIEPEAAARLGVVLWDPPGGAQVAWAEGPWGELGWSPPADQKPSPLPVVMGLPAALLEDAEFRPLVVVGRERQMPLAVLGIGLRYHSGPWRGATLVILSPGLGSWSPFGPDGRASDKLVEWASSPLVPGPWFDYPLVRAGEDLRLPIEALVRHDDHRSFTLSAILRGADGREIDRVEGVEPMRSRGAGFMDSLRAIVRFDGRRWPRPCVFAEVAVRYDRAIVATGQGMVVTWEPSVLRRGMPSSVTGRRLVVSGSGEPVLGMEIQRPWHSPGGLPAERRDLLAWDATFARMADAGVRLARIESAMATASQPGEFERRFDAALLSLADARGIAVELVPVISDGRALLFEELADFRLAPSMLLSPSTAGGLGLLRELWPASRVVPPPSTPSYSGPSRVPPAVEALSRLGREPVRLALRGGSFDLSAAMEAMALGIGGTLHSAEGQGLEPRLLQQLTAAKLVTSLLQADAHQPSLALVAANPADSPLFAAFSRLHVNWGLFSMEGLGDVPLATSAVVIEEAGSLTEEQRYVVLARARRGARVLSTDRGLLGHPIRETSFGQVSRQADGYTGWLDLSRPDSVSEAADWLGCAPIVTEETAGDEPLRVIRNRCQGGEFVVIVAAGGERRAVTVDLSGHEVRLGVSRDCPAVVAYGPDGPWLIWSLGSVSIDGSPWLSVPDESYTMFASQLGEPLDEARVFLGVAEYQGDGELVLEPALWRSGEPALEHCAAVLSNLTLREVCRRRCEAEDGLIHVRLEARNSGLPFALAPSARLEQPLGRIAALLR